jgi:hypothetical protein
VTFITSSIMAELNGEKGNVFKELKISEEELF